MPMNQTNAISIYNDFQNESKYTVTVPLILGNNFFQCLVLFTSFIGPLYGILVFFNTGFVVADIAVAKSEPSLVVFVSIQFPCMWLEFFAYSLALSQSTFLALAIVKG
jgi:hypothetical protein